MADQMMMSPGLLQQYGLTDMPLDEYTLAKQRVMSQQARDQVYATGQGRDPYVNDMRAAGAGIGAAMFGGRPSDEETNRIEAVQAAQQRMANRGLSVSTDKKLEGEDAQLQFQAILADEMMNRGEYNLGTQMMANLTERQRAIEAQKQQLKQAGLQTKGMESDLVLSQINEMREKNNIHPVWTMNGQMADMRINNETGYAINDLTGEMYPPGSYTTDQNLAMMWGIGGSASDMTSYQRSKLHGSAPAVDFRAKRDEMEIQMGSMNELKKILERDAELHGGSVTVLGKGGEAIGWVQGAIDTMGQLTASVFGNDRTPVTVDGEVVELGTYQDALRFVENNKHIKTLITDAGKAALGKDFPENAGLQARWAAEIVRLAYAQARANEPANRGLSNDDFENALAAIAGATSSPEAMRQVLVRNLQSNFNRWNNQWKDLEAVGLTNVYLGESRYKEFRDKYDTFMDDWNNLQWSYEPIIGIGAPAQAPGAGVTPPPTPQGKTPGGFQFSIRSVIPGR